MNRVLIIALFLRLRFPFNECTIDDVSVKPKYGWECKCFAYCNGMCWNGICHCRNIMRHIPTYTQITIRYIIYQSRGKCSNSATNSVLFFWYLLWPVQYSKILLIVEIRLFSIFWFHASFLDSKTVNRKIEIISICNLWSLCLKLIISNDQAQVSAIVPVGYYSMVINLLLYILWGRRLKRTDGSGFYHNRVINILPVLQTSENV